MDFATIELVQKIKFCLQNTLYLDYWSLNPDVTGLWKKTEL